MNIELKRKIIHDLNNLRQLTEFHGHIIVFYTCTRVEKIFLDNRIVTDCYRPILEKVCEEKGLFLGTFICTNDNNLRKEARKEALKRLVENIENNKFDYLLI